MLGTNSEYQFPLAELRNFSNILRTLAPFGFKLQILDAYSRSLSVSIPFVFLLQRGFFFSALPFSCKSLSLARRVTLAKNNNLNKFIATVN